MVTLQQLLLWSTAQMLFVCIQFNSLRQTIEALTGDLDIAAYATGFFAFFIFFCELLGGFGAIAMTDRPLSRR